MPTIEKQLCRVKAQVLLRINEGLLQVTMISQSGLIVESVNRYDSS